jgi:hypothetical protein
MQPASISIRRSMYLSICVCLISQSLTHSLNQSINSKSIIFWGITPCSLLNVKRRFGGTYRLHLQVQKIS